MAKKLLLKRMSALEILWVTTLCLFPITTPPFLLVANTEAKPLSIIPAMMIVLLVFLLGGKRLQYIVSREAKTLYIFLSASLLGYLSSILVGSLDVDMMRMFSFLRASFALLMGILFYLSFRMMNTNHKEIRRSELILLAAMSLSVAVEVLQFLIMNWFVGLSFVVDFIDSVFVGVSSQGEWVDRFHGLAYEPSWLASQISLIMLPISLSRIVAKETLGLFGFGVIRIRLEWLFFMFSLLGIILSGSRTALFSAIFMFIVTAFSGATSVRKTILNALWLGLILIIVIGASMSNEYVVDTFNAIVSNKNDPFQMLMSISAAPRVSAWNSAWNIFLQHPFLGVGLGNSTYFYVANVPDWSLGFPEVQGWINSSGVNPKNMLLKLASESGLIGFIIFAVFVLGHFRGKNTEMRYKILRNTGIVALIFNYFSLDTFALPTEWYLLGFIIVLGNATLTPNSTLVHRGEIR